MKKCRVAINLLLKISGDDGNDAVGEWRDPVDRLDRAQHSNLHRNPDETTKAGNHDVKAKKVSNNDHKLKPGVNLIKCFGAYLGT